jgi:hypothetical protein
MVLKMTVRLPDALAAQLREKSRRSGHSLNATAIGALARGLETDDGQREWWRALGDLVEEPPTERFDAAEFDRMRVQLEVGEAQGLMDELDWVRGGRLDTDG